MHGYIQIMNVMALKKDFKNVIDLKNEGKFGKEKRKEKKKPKNKTKQNPREQIDEKNYKTNKAKDNRHKCTKLLT